MILDRHLFKISQWIFSCFFFGLFLYVYINYIIVRPLHNLKQRFSALLFSSSTLCLSDIEARLLAHDSSLNSTPSEGFITFSDNYPNYLALLTNLLDSVHYFSTRPIIAFGIDVDLNVTVSRYPRLIKRRLNRNDCGPSIYFCKIHAIIESKLDYGVHLEADSVVNWNVDVLFDVVHQWHYSLPLSPRHASDPRDYANLLKTFDSIWKVQALDMMRQAHFMGANFDETGINILLWIAKANHTLCKIDPHPIYLQAYESKEKTCKDSCHTAFILIYGWKDVIRMRDVFQRLKAHVGSPFIQTPNEGLHYLNETQYTCCYPDSQPSPIHPLLCQYSTNNH